MFHDDQADQYDSYPDPGFSTGAGSSTCDGHDSLVDPCGLFHDDQADQYDSYPDSGFSTGADSGFSTGADSSTFDNLSLIFFIFKILFFHPKNTWNALKCKINK